MYKFTPIVKTLVWGTERWLVSSVPGSESLVAEGPDAGRSIRDVWGGEFPLLVKIVDARLDLSIQVHPDEELALERHGCHGKTEMWYVTGADPGARLLCGFREEIRPEQYAGLVESGRIADALAPYDVAVGDVFFLPAGRVHAICGGCHVAEIQQTSDITYRIYDYKRPGLDGKPRQLHTDMARDAIDYRVLPDYRTKYRRFSDRRVGLVQCPYFTTDWMHLTREKQLSLKGCGDFLILVCVDGEATIQGAAHADSHTKGPGADSGARTAESTRPDSSRMEIRAGEAVLVLPSDGPLHILPARGDATFLTTHI